MNTRIQELEGLLRDLRPVSAAAHQHRTKDMTQSELKELKNLGAELGAAKAENDRLREALRWYEEKVAECRKIGSLGDNARQALDRDGGFRARDALSQQAEPVEPAPAQDEQYPPCDFCGVIPDHHPWHGSGLFNGVDSPHIHACNGCRHLLPVNPAQTEQQPVAIPEAVRAWMMDVPLPDNEYGYRLTNRRDELLAAPIAQPEQSEQLDEFRKLLERAVDALDYYYPGTRIEADINDALERYR